MPAGLFTAPQEEPDILSSHFDEVRFRQLQAALVNPNSKAIWCLRGGYGSIRLVPSLLKLKKPKRVKPIIGLSDVTTLQLFLQEKWNWPSLHGPLLDRLGRTLVGPVRDFALNQGKPIPPQSQVLELSQVLNGEACELSFEGLRSLNSVKGSICRGVISGGNLVTFASAIGTKIHPKTAGKILFFEDIGERGYRVDRILEQMVQAEVFSKKTRAIIFGEFIAGNEPDGTSKVLKVIERFAKTWAQKNGVPVLSGLPIGHGENQRVIPFNTDAVLDLKSGALKVKTGV